MTVEGMKFLTWSSIFIGHSNRMSPLWKCVARLRCSSNGRFAESGVPELLRFVGACSRPG